MNFNEFIFWLYFVSINKNNIIFYLLRLNEINKIEIWKPISEFPNNYEISNFGRIRNIKTKHILKPFINNDGYPFVVLHLEKGHSINRLVHRLLAIEFLPNPKHYPIINHKDEDRKNNKLENLEWCSYSYNCTYNDAAKKRGLKQKGEVSPRKGIKGVSKETSEKLSIARKEYIKKFGISEKTKEKISNSLKEYYKNAK